MSRRLLNIAELFEGPKVVVTLRGVCFERWDDADALPGAVLFVLDRKEYKVNQPRVPGNSCGLRFDRLTSSCFSCPGMAQMR